MRILIILVLIACIGIVFFFIPLTEHIEQIEQEPPTAADSLNKTS